MLVLVPLTFEFSHCSMHPLRRLLSAALPNPAPHPRLCMPALVPPPAVAPVYAALHLRGRQCRAPERVRLLGPASEVAGHDRLQALAHMAGQPPLLASPTTLALVERVVRMMQGPCNSEDPAVVWLQGTPGNGMSTLLRQAARVTEHVTPNMMAAYIPLVNGTECMLNVQYVALRLVQSRDMLTPAGMDFMHKSVPANVDLLCDTLARHCMTMTLYLDNAEALLGDKRFSGSIADYETMLKNLDFVQQLMAAGGPVRCVMASSSASAPLKFSGQWAAAVAAWPVRGCVLQCMGSCSA